MFAKSYQDVNPFATQIQVTTHEYLAKHLGDYDFSELKLVVVDEADYFLEKNQTFKTLSNFVNLIFKRDQEALKPLRNSRKLKESLGLLTQNPQIAFFSATYEEKSKINLAKLAQGC